MNKSCVGCKYNFRSDKKEPCKTGVWNIYYSGECLQYKPSLMTRLKKRLKRRGDGMTDEMKAREKAICEAAKVNSIGEVSDGFHTFNGLYEQRMILFAALVKAYKDKAWKSYRHEDGEYCFGGGWFIVGIDTPEGSYTYHYEDNYYSLFDCEELERGKHWDGHTEADAETRLMSLNPEPHWIPVTEGLPKKCNTTYLATVDYGKHGMAVGQRFFFGDNIGWNDKSVVAWMPLPEPYKGVTE